MKSVERRSRSSTTPLKITSKLRSENGRAETKKLERSFILQHVSEEEQDELFRHLYLVLKPNEANVNESTSAMLRLIEEEVPGYEKECGLSESNSTILYEFRNGELQKHGEDSEVSVRSTINRLFPQQRSRPVSPDAEKTLTKRGNGRENNNVPLKPLNLTATLKVPLMSSASELSDLCQKMSDENYATNSIYDDLHLHLLLPTPHSNAPKNLHLKVPLIYVDKKEDAQNSALRAKCLDSPLVVIRGLVDVLDVKLSKFTSNTIKQIADNYQMELREQWLNASIPGGSAWHYPSYVSSCQLSTYIQYQGETFGDAITDAHKILENRRRKRAMHTPYERNGRASKEGASLKADKIYFGTNVDFSGPQFKEQVEELQKLPPFLRLEDKSNFLSYLGYDLKGMNTSQFYMKVRGCRTPAHLENNTYSSINLNIGPGDCTWFGCPYEYYPMIDQMCKDRGLDFLTSAWWPLYDELIAAGIPVYRFTQRRRDVVFVNGGTIHWVEANGWCNNIAWNVGPACAEQMKMNIMSVEFNFNRRFVSLVPLQYLTWRLAAEFRTDDLDLYKTMRGVLVRSLAHTMMIANIVGREGLTVEYLDEDPDLSTTVCTHCTAEIFNFIFVVPRRHGKHVPYCLQCVKELAFDRVEVWQVFRIEKLKRIFDEFKPQGR